MQFYNVSAHARKSNNNFIYFTLPSPAVLGEYVRMRKNVNSSLDGFSPASCIGYLVYIDSVVGMVTFVRMRKSVNSSLHGFSTFSKDYTVFEFFPVIKLH